MILSKKVIKEFKRVLQETDTTQAEAADFCLCGQTYISRVIKYRECSEEMYGKILKFIAAKNKELSNREAKENKVLSTSN